MLELASELSGVFIFLCGMAAMWIAEKLRSIGKRDHDRPAEERQKTK